MRFLISSIVILDLLSRLSTIHCVSFPALLYVLPLYTSVPCLLYKVWSVYCTSGKIFRFVWGTFFHRLLLPFLLLFLLFLPLLTLHIKVFLPDNSFFKLPALVIECGPFDYKARTLPLHREDSLIV